MFRYAYFPGCSAESSAIEYDMSTREVCKKLGIELVDIPFNCCGTHIVEEFDECSWLALNARNLALAEELGLDMVTICSSCFYNLRKANAMIRQSEEVRKRINDILGKIGRMYDGKVEVKHILGVLVDDYGIDGIIRNVEKLIEIKASPYYGCLILRPEEIVQFDNPEAPRKMEDLLETIGCEIFENPFKVDCCGAPIMLIDKKTHLKMVEKILEGAKGADCIVTVCPLCHYALDVGQAVIGYEPKIPVLHVTQILGLALGIPAEKLGLDKNVTPTEPLLKKI
mgnify:CR=1 FL=1